LVQVAMPARRRADIAADLWRLRDEADALALRTVATAVHEMRMVARVGGRP
jgi:hypothetical protein